MVGFFSVLCFSVAILFFQIPRGHCASIIGGKESFPHSRPFMALIKGKEICGGTLIKRSWVLTAAHCSLGSKPTVILGAHSFYKNETSRQYFKVAKWIPSPHYNKYTHEHDTMLLQLQGRAKLNPAVRTIRLPTTYDDLKVGTPCLIAGWGITHNGSRKPSDTLREANVIILERRICNDRKHYNHNPVITQNMLCAGVHRGGKDACKGDSGGPLICNGEQRGIIAVGIKGRCGTIQYPGIYTRLAKYHLSWIHKTTIDNL